MTNISSEGIAKIYRDDIWKLHGIPRKILSDRGPQFASKFMEEFTKALGTKRNYQRIPSTNRWSNRKNQPRDRNISATLRELPIG